MYPLSCSEKVELLGKSELLGKRLELLKAVVPKISRFAFLDDTASEGYKNVAKETQSTAQTLGVQLQRIEVRDSNPEMKTFSK